MEVEIEQSRMHALEDRALALSSLVHGLSSRRAEAREALGLARMRLDDAQKYAKKPQGSLAARLGVPTWPLGQARELAKGEKIPPPTIPAKWLEDPGAAALAEAEREVLRAEEEFERIDRAYEAAGARAGAANGLLRRCQEFVGRGASGQQISGRAA